MINKTLYIICLVMIITASVKAQNPIESVLSEIATNNKSILANKQYWEAKKLNYKTGLNPSNPKIEYEYLSGSPATAGSQIDIILLQEFDFPTSYIKKKQVANEQIAKVEFEEKAFKQNVLLKAKQHCIELIFLNKRKIELDKRLMLADKLHNDFKIKFDNGDANSMDVNKAHLQLINLHNEVRLNASLINRYNQKLIELNGGIEIIFNEMNYPLNLNKEVPDFKTLENTIEMNDPILKSYQQEKEIAQKKIELSRAMTFPKMEGGYHSQKILGQSFQGVHIGLTIPLWEGKNSVKHQKEQLIFNDLLIKNHSTEHFYEIKQLYEKAQSLRITLHEYEPVLNSLTNNTLLGKSFQLGEISSIQYFMELNYFYEALDDYLTLEKEYYMVLSELDKYKL